MQLVLICDGWGHEPAAYSLVEVGGQAGYRQGALMRGERESALYVCLVCMFVCVYVCTTGRSKQPPPPLNSLFLG